jgi:general stress protein 26
MKTTPEKKLQDILDGFSVAMLVTRSSSLRARPMALAEVQNGTVWFVTGRSTEKINELAQDNNVLITMQSKTRFISLSGKATIVDDRAKVAQLWKPEWKVWFPGGKEDPDITLIRVEGETGEYWDDSGMAGIRYLVEAGIGLLTGTKPKVDDDIRLHGKVSL